MSTSVPTRLANVFSSRSNSYTYFLLPYFSTKPYRGRSGPTKLLPLRQLGLYPFKAVRFAICFIIILLLLAAGVLLSDRKIPEILPEFLWSNYERFNGYYQGIRTLVPLSQYIPEYSQLDSSDAPSTSRIPKLLPWFSSKTSHDTFNETLSPGPIVFDPYPNYASADYLLTFPPVKECYLDAANVTRLPDIFIYPGLPQHQTAAPLGSYQELGLRDDICFERFGRLGPYGYGYEKDKGGSGAGLKVESKGSELIWQQMNGQIDWLLVDWNDAQNRCYARNKARFEVEQPSTESSGRRLISRTAIVLRTWGDFYYDPHILSTIRAIITELALKSGGEYTVHFLVDIKEITAPIWASEEVYQETLRRLVPEEFRGMATLWSEKQMEMIYPGPFEDNVENMSGSGIYGVYRSGHMALQYFASQHPEYDFFWNWEMDIRYTGHYYELFERLKEWAKRQPRKALWERSARFYIPAFHGPWDEFSQRVEREVEGDNEEPIWGPVRFPELASLGPEEDTRPPFSSAEDQDSAGATWGVGEEADLITLNPLFDPNNTHWIFRNDVTGYNRSYPVPPRRAAIITAARLSRRLLMLMHEETFRLRHTMFPEMWSPTVALHHGLKAVFAPHPVYMDRKWPLDVLAATFNGGKSGSSGGKGSSLFGPAEHNFGGTTWYSNAGFSGALWRRWLGMSENGEGGVQAESKGTGRMCLRSVLVHPVKHEQGPLDPP